MTTPDDAPGPDGPDVPTSPVVPAYEAQGVPVDDHAEPPDAGHEDGEG